MMKEHSLNQIRDPRIFSAIFCSQGFVWLLGAAWKIAAASTSENIIVIEKSRAPRSVYSNPKRLQACIVRILGTFAPWSTPAGTADCMPIFASRP